MPFTAPVKILLVDDLHEKHVVYHAALEDPDLELVSVMSGEDALKAVLEDDFAVILLDINMPGMDGFETASLIRSRKRCGHTPIIFITAFPDELFAVKGYALGAVDYILAPIVPNILKTKVGVFVQLFRLNQQVKQQAAEQIAIVEKDRARLASVLENAPDFVGRADDQGRLIHVNAAGRKLLGLGEDASLADGRSLFLNRWLPSGSLSIARANGVWFGESIIHDRTGRDIAVSQIIIAHKNDQGQVESYSIFARDISERKRAEEAIHTLAAERAQLLESERNARSEAERLGRLKDEFLATLSHELRTPLNAVLGWAKLLQGPKVTPEDVAEGLDVIARNARVQAQLVADLLDMNRIISGKLQLNLSSMEVSRVISEAIETVRPSATAKRITLKFDEPAEEFAIVADEGRIQQVIWNLLTNAIKFTPQGGSVEVNTAIDDEVLEITVSDTGEGIAPEFMPYLFDRFRQADASSARRHGGLGLGLAIVKQLVELHGGTIKAQSSGRGGGASFTIMLPIQIPDVTESPRIAPDRIDEQDEDFTGDSPRLAGLRILVVDDEPDSVHLAKRVLEDCQAEVSVAYSAAEAFDQLHRCHPDVLISDIGMPIEDGYSLIRRVRRTEGGRPDQLTAIAMTAFARPEDRRRALEAGYQEHLTKPVDPRQLVRIVATMTEGKTSGANGAVTTGP